MKHVQRSIIGLFVLSTLAGAGSAQEAAPAQSVQGVERLKGIMEGLRRGDTSKLPAKDKALVDSAATSASAAAAFKPATPSSLNSIIADTARMQSLSREAYVSALPPRDQAWGAKVLLGDKTEVGSGQLYYFVSRSMPLGMLKAYALDALYTGGTLVFKGVRKGDTLKEYFEEVVSEFNSSEGQPLASVEMNPNLYDMFDIKVVPTIVWTNRAGLDDVGSGCENLPDGVPTPKVSVEGPDGAFMSVDKPVCAPLPPTTYYKLGGAVSTWYALEKFERAGAPLEAITSLRKSLAQFKSNVNQAQGQQVGNAVVPIDYDLKLDAMPVYVLQAWAESLKTMNVQRSAFGPAFSVEGEDDGAYRKELQMLIDKGLASKS